MTECALLAKYSKTKYVIRRLSFLCLSFLNKRKIYTEPKKAKNLAVIFNLRSQVFVTVAGVKLVSQMLMMKRVKCNEFYLTH